MLSDNITIRPTDDANNIITELYNSLLHRYQETLENKMEGSNFAYAYINFLDIKFNTIDLIRGGTYIPSPKWISNKKATINPLNNEGEDVYCFMYAITISLNHTEIGKHSERISKIIPYIPNYNCEHINFPAQRKDWENFEKDNDDIALNILCVLHNKKKQQRYTTNQNLIIHA